MNRMTMLAIMASLLVTHIAAFATAAFATPLSRELASDSVTLRKHGSVYRDGWVRWLGWSGAGWGFVGPGGGKGWMGIGWGWRGVGPHVAPIYVSRNHCRRSISISRGWASSLSC
jgi:hypothetical protein